MNKNLIFILIGLLVAAGLLYFVIANTQTNNTPIETDLINTETDTPTITPTITPASASETDTNVPGQYLPFEQSAFDQTADQTRVLFFYANWCPTCIAADEDIQANQDQIPNNVTIFRTNYNDDDTDDTEDALADEYGITYQHTFVQIDADGNPVTTWNGGSLDELIKNLQ